MFSILYKFFVLSKNTFIEIIRKPIYGVIIAAVLFLLILSPSITMYTMSDDNKLLRELGLSTLFLASLFIAIFSASSAVADEIENKTISTILTKPVQRPMFIIAKFFGVTAAVILAHYICTLAFLMAIRHGVTESVSDSLDWTVIITGMTVIIGSFFLSALFNYVYDWKLSSTIITLIAVSGTLGIIFLTFFDKNWEFNPAQNNFQKFDIYGSILLLLAAIIIIALAILFSSRFNIVITLSACIGIFLLGLINDYAFGRLADFYAWAKIGRYILPNLQVFWISDAIYEESVIPLKYILISAGYALSYTAGILAVAVGMFQKRQIG